MSLTPLCPRNQLVMNLQTDEASIKEDQDRLSGPASPSSWDHLSVVSEKKTLWASSQMKKEKRTCILNNMLFSLISEQIILTLHLLFCMRLQTRESLWLHNEMHAKATKSAGNHFHKRSDTENVQVNTFWRFCSSSFSCWTAFRKFDLMPEVPLLPHFGFSKVSWVRQEHSFSLTKTWDTKNLSTGQEV